MQIRLIAFLIVLLPAALTAQPVPSRDPSSTHIFPAGGRRGSVVTVRVGSECLPPGARFRLWGNGVAAPPVLGHEAPWNGERPPRRLPTEVPVAYPREWHSTIEISAAATLGPAMWRLSCAQGGTGARPFIVGDLPELVETESNSRFDRAERVSLPITINGQICGERDIDYYRFSAHTGDVVTCDLLASRLGSPLDPVIEMFDEDGRRLRAEEFRLGNDPVMSFRAPKTGDYVLLISHLGVNGSPKYVYRATLSTAPFVVQAFPPGSSVGETRDVILYTLSGTPTFRELRDSVVAPSTAGDFWYHGSTHRTNPIPLVAGTLPEVVETEPNNTVKTATRITLPTTLNGQFFTLDDEDWVNFDADKDRLYSLEVRPFPAGLPTLPVVSLVDSKGAVLAEAKSLDSEEKVCRIEWRATFDGPAFVRIRDMQQGIRGGPHFVYRLAVRESPPDFTLSLNQDFVHVTQGAGVDVQLAVRRTGGFEDPIDLAFDGLPEHVKIEPAQVPEKSTSVTLKFSTTPEARPTDTAIRIIGRAAVGGKTIEHVAVAPHWGLDPEGVSAASPVIDNLNLTVRPKPPFRLFCNEAYQYARRGTIFRYPMEIERLDGYDGDIVVQIGDRQNRDLDGVEMLEVTLRKETANFHMPIYFPETMHINVQSQSQLYVQAYTSLIDDWGERQSFLVVSEKRCLVRTMPTVAKLVCTADPETTERKRCDTTTARTGDTIRCRLELQRTSNFSGEMAVTLVSPATGFRAKSVSFAPGETSANVLVHIEREAAPYRDLTLKFRGLGTLEDGTTVISEAFLPLKLLTARF